MRRVDACRLACMEMCGPGSYGASGRGRGGCSESDPTAETTRLVNKLKAQLGHGRPAFFRAVPSVGRQDPDTRLPDLIPTREQIYFQAMLRKMPPRWPSQRTGRLEKRIEQATRSGPSTTF